MKFNKINIISTLFQIFDDMIFFFVLILNSELFKITNHILNITFFFTAKHNIKNFKSFKLGVI